MVLAVLKHFLRMRFFDGYHYNYWSYIFENSYLEHSSFDLGLANIIKMEFGILAHRFVDYYAVKLRQSRTL